MKILFLHGENTFSSWWKYFFLTMKKSTFFDKPSATTHKTFFNTYHLTLPFIANNINKNTSTKTLQPDREVDFKPSKKPGVFLFWALSTCKRATLGSWKGHYCDATMALLQARLGSFKPIFSPGSVPTNFKQLIINTLQALSKIAYSWRSGCSSRISQTERPKTNK